MDRQGFDPMEKNLFEVVDFMENIESVEETPFEKVKSSNKEKDSKKKDSKGNKKKPAFYCKEHGPNNTHDTKDCKVLANKSTGSNNDKKKSFGNKTWTRKAEDSTSYTKKELAVLVQKAAKKEIKKHAKDLNSVSKKRKSSDSSESDDDDDKECFLLDTITKDLDGFNYQEMNDLKIDSDDEVSC
jgi:hypothetical protein